MRRFLLIKPLACPGVSHFVLDYFRAEQGEGELSGLEVRAGLEPITQPGSEEQPLVGIAKRLARLGLKIGGNKEHSEAFKRLADRSQGHVVSNIQDALNSGSDLEDCEHIYILTEPDKTMTQVHQVQRMREFLRLVRHDLAARDDLHANVRDALLVSVDALRQKATEQLGKLYPDMVSLYHQALLLREAGPEQTQELVERLTVLVSPIHKIVNKIEGSDGRNGDNIKRRFAFTMDRWRNGVVKSEPGEDTSFSVELLQLEEELDAGIDNNPERQLAAFTDEEIAHLDTLDFGPEDVADMMRHWAARNGVLSNDISDRFAPGKWPSDSTKDQPRLGVVIGEFPNISYGDGWLKIPRGTRRKLRQQVPSGPALVVPHELQHAIDGITAEYGEKQVAVAGVGARNSGGVREGYGKQEENKASLDLFGEPLRQSTAYIKALRTWGETGSESAATVAFAEQVALERGLDGPTAKLLENAQNRVQRLIRYGARAGDGWNSQALVYVEQVLVAQGLDDVSPEVRDMVAANSYLDLPLMVRFHEFGLLATDRYQPEVTPIQAMEEYLHNLLHERGN